MPTPALATQPPPVHLQLYICEHRAGPDELRSRLIRRDRFLDPTTPTPISSLSGTGSRPANSSFSASAATTSA